MCKEMNVVLIYLAGLLLAVEKYNGQTLAILFIVMIGCWMSIHGEMNPSTVGFAIQMISQTSEVIKIIIQQMIMQGMRVDPLTMVMTMSPLCLCTLSVGLYFLWEPGTFEDAHHMAYHLCLNGLNAFALNIAVALVIRHASGVSFVLAGVIKDILIVTFAAIFTGALVSRLQIAGFTIAVMGVAAHSLVRSHQDFVDNVLSHLSLKKQTSSGERSEA
jgi:solute carrier family 35 protein C2